VSHASFDTVLLSVIGRDISHALIDHQGKSGARGRPALDCLSFINHLFNDRMIETVCASR
jgi:hypothetical protein